jgi:SIR2-like domain
MAWADFATTEFEDVIEHFASADPLTVLAGAGVSMEARLPSWEGLVHRVLGRCSEALITGTDPDIREHRKLWVEETFRSEGAIGAAGVVEALNPAQLHTWVEHELFDGQGPAAFVPGPVAAEIAALKTAHGSEIEIMTLNYDDLIEQAMDVGGAGPGVPVTEKPATAAKGERRVIHLHGHLGTLGRSSWIVLSENHYQAMAASSWQRDLVVDRLAHPCLFVGTSLVDDNLIRYLYESSTQTPTLKHAAIFTLHGQRTRVPDAVIDARRRATAARWRSRNVRPVFVEHYSDVTALVREVRLRRERGSAYRPLPLRARDWVRAVEKDLIKKGDNAAFRNAQDRLNGALQNAVESAERYARAYGHDLADERISLGLWLAGEDGRTLTNWATSDRVFTRPRSLQALKTEADSTWISIETFVRGVRIDSDRTHDFSRWQFIRGLPVMATGQDGDFLAGVLTITSVRDIHQTMLTRLPPDLEAEIHRIFMNAVVTLLPSVG